MNFTPHQLSVINAPLDINLKVVAVPGSGKSTVLIYRIEKFLLADFASKDIMVVMFNDDAVINFRNDLKNIDFMDVPEVKTYHSLGRFLCHKLEKANLLFSANLVTSTHDYNLFYKSVLQHHTPLAEVKNIRPESGSTLKQFIRFVELTKTGMLEPEITYTRYSFADKFKIFIDLFEHSERDRLALKKRFFTDLIRDPVLCCLHNKKAFNYIANQYRVVMVDEYQDASAICHELIKLIAGTKANVNVVGDPDQAIYSFTGASFEFLLSTIDRDFPNVQFFSLPDTFRYGHSVSLMANNCISNNLGREDIIGLSALSYPTKISIANYTAELVDTEHHDLIHEIQKWTKQPDNNLSDIAILVRSFSPLSGLLFALVTNKIPFKLGAKPNNILQSENILWIESVLRIYCPTSTEQCINHSLYIFLSSFSTCVNQAIINTVLGFLIAEEYDEALMALKPHFKTLPRLEYMSLRARIQALSIVDKLGYVTAEDLILRVCEHSRILTSVDRADYSSNNTGRRAFIAARQFFLSFNTDVSGALSKLEILRNNVLKQTDDCIEIKTLHTSKGLAWPFVIVGFLEENIFPNLTLEKNVEAERCLYYVGITRAKKQLTLHIPSDDKKLIAAARGNEGAMSEGDLCTPFMASRFVYESNVIASVNVASAIYKNTGADIGQTSNLDLFNRYLGAIYSDFRLSGL